MQILIRSSLACTGRGCIIYSDLNSGRTQTLSAWRARALELFPSLSSEIQAAETVSSLWIELFCRLQQYYDSETDAADASSRTLIRSICLYAIWCTRSHSPKTREAAWIGFYEDVGHLAAHSKPSTYKRILKDMVENLGIEEIERSPQAFAARLRPNEFKKFLTDARHAESERLRSSQKRYTS